MSVRRILVATAAIIMTVGGLTVAMSTGATASSKLCAVKVGDKVKYVVCSSVPGSNENTGGGDTGPAPECELTESYPTYCKSEGVACLLNDPALNDQEDVEDDAGPKPEAGDEEYHIAYESCSDGSGRDWFWTTGETVSTEDLALQAFGELTFTPYTMTFNPPNRTFVNLDTWWWAEGATTDTLVGTSAGAVRALARPDRMEIDPGDGSGVMNCDFVITKSDDCTYTYRKANAKDGAYPARMRLVWSVSFEDGGTVLNLPGLPTAFTSPWQDVDVPVREVQTLSRPNS